MPTPEKAVAIEETAHILEGAEGVVLASYKQLSVAQLSRLRRELSKGGVAVKVVKNTLVSRAASQAGIQGLDPYLTGPTVLFTSDSDPVAPARMLQANAREFRTVEIKAGVLNKVAIPAADVRALASLPSRQQLLGQVVGTLNMPIQQLVWVLQAPLAQLARALDQVRQQRADAEI